MSIIYGIDTDQMITPVMVRDALVECFYQAHCEDTGLDSSSETGNKSYCAALVKKAFDETKGSFEHPTKEDLGQVMEYLVEFSKNFRDPSIVLGHAKEMEELLKKVQ